MIDRFDERGLCVSADIHMERQAIMAVLHGSVIEALDLKNKRVAELEKRFDRLERQTMLAQRREAMARMRRKR